MEEKRINDLPKEHPTYGMIAIHRCNSSGTHLVGTDMCHNSFISLKISTASYKRQLNQDFWFEDDKIIEVALSHSQWAEFISSMNTQGVPCTLEWLPNTGRVKEPVPRVDKMSLHKQEFEDKYKEKILESLQIINRLQDGLSEKMGKREQRELLHTLECNIGNLRANIPFAINQFNEAVEDRMNHAKGELKSFLVNMGFIKEGQPIAALPIKDERLITNGNELEQN